MPAQWRSGHVLLIRTPHTLRGAMGALHLSEGLGCSRWLWAGQESHGSVFSLPKTWRWSLLGCASGTEMEGPASPERSCQSLACRGQSQALCLVQPHLCQAKKANWYSQDRELQALVQGVSGLPSPSRKAFILSRSPRVSLMGSHDSNMLPYG